MIIDDLKYLFRPMGAVNSWHWRHMARHRLRIFWRLTLPSWFCRHRKTEPCATWTSSYDICKSCLKTLNWRAHGPG